MDSDLTRLTVFFEAPFWVGVFERFEGGTLSVCKITFGAEAKGKAPGTVTVRPLYVRRRLRRCSWRRRIARRQVVKKS